MTTKADLLFTHRRPARSGVAIVLATGLLIVVAFQAALTLGAPFGAAAMGGTNPGRLPDPERIVTGFASLVWLFGAFVVLARGGTAVGAMPQAVAQVGTWILVGLLGVGTLMNFASPSSWERFGWGPFTLIMCILCFLVARSGPAPAQQADRLQVAAIASGRLSPGVDRKRAGDELSENDHAVRLEAMHQRREAQEHLRSMIEASSSSRFSR